MVLANFAEVKHIEGEFFAKIQAYLGRNWVFFSHLGSIFRPETSFSICFKKKTCMSKVRKAVFRKVQNPRTPHFVTNCGEKEIFQRKKLDKFEFHLFFNFMQD